MRSSAIGVWMGAVYGRERERRPFASPETGKGARNTMVKNGCVNSCAGVRRARAFSACAQRDSNDGPRRQRKPADVIHRETFQPQLVGAIGLRGNNDLQRRYAIAFEGERMIP
jgi:hypothetical protein